MQSAGDRGAVRFNMSKRVILITGGNGGLGQAIARAFLHESADNEVWLGMRAKRDKADALAAEFAGRCQCVELEVTQPENWKAAVSGIVTKSQRIDVLVNNAGSHQDSLLANMTPGAWQQVLATNLDSVFHGCQAVLPTMISQRHGRIVNIASLSALLAPMGQTNYAAAKAGVVGFTKALAREIGSRGITVNAIAPGYIETSMTDGMNEDQKKALVGQIVLGRLGTAADVAGAVVYLASDAAAYVTGTCLNVSGGLYIG
jgi:3-oxoacyl-[acyl-carrier protein] reductase